MERENTVQMTSEKPKPVEQQGHNPGNSTVRAQTQTPLLQAANSMQVASQNPPFPPRLREGLLPETQPFYCRPTALRPNESLLPDNVSLQPQNPPVSPSANKSLLPVSIQSAFKSPTHPVRQKHLLPAVSTPLNSQVERMFPTSNERLQPTARSKLDPHQTFIPSRFKTSLLAVNNPLESQRSHIPPNPRSQLTPVNTSQDTPILNNPTTSGNINTQETVEVSIKVGSQESHILCSGSERPLSPIHFQMTTFSMPLTSRQQEMIQLSVNEVLQIQLLQIPPTPNARQLLIHNAQPQLQQHPTLSNRGQRPTATDNASAQSQMKVPSRPSERPPPVNILRSTPNPITFNQPLPVIPNLAPLQRNVRNPSTRPNVAHSIVSLTNSAAQYYDPTAERNTSNLFLGRQKQTQRALSVEPSDDQAFPCKSQEEAANEIPVTREQMVSYQEPQRLPLELLSALKLQKKERLSHEGRLLSPKQGLLSQELALSEERRLVTQEQASWKTTAENIQRLLSEEKLWEETSDSDSPPGIRTEDLSKYNRISRRMGVRHRRKRVVHRRLHRFKRGGNGNAKHAAKEGEQKILSKPKRSSSSEEALGNYNLQRIPPTEISNSGLKNRGGKTCQIAKDDMGIGTSSTTNSQRAGNAHIKQVDKVHKMNPKAKRKLIFDSEFTRQITDSNTCEASVDKSIISKLSTCRFLYSKERVGNRTNNPSDQNYEEKSTENVTTYSVSKDVQKFRKGVSEEGDSKESGYEICERETPGNSNRIQLALIDAKDSDDRKKDNSPCTTSSS